MLSRIINALTLLLSASVVSAQNDDPRIRQSSPGASVASMEIRTVRYIYTKTEVKQRTDAQVLLDIHPKKDTTIIDTIKIEKKYFSISGSIDSSFSKFYVIRRHYYTHLNDTSWYYITRYEYDRVDSTLVLGDSAVSYIHDYGKLRNRLVYSGNDAYYESLKKPGKRMSQAHWISSPDDSFWDYKSAGTFADRKIAVNGNVDTVTYSDANGDVLIRTVNHYDSLGQCVRTDYFNQGVRRFALIHLYVNPHVGDASLYLRSKGKQLSMQCERKYDSRGLLTEECWRNPDDKRILMKRLYYYRHR